MKYNFDMVIERKGTRCSKWDKLEDMYGDESVIPMWVADMDFPVCDEIQKAIMKRAEHPIYGYTIRSEEYNKAVVNWMKTRHAWNIKEEWITFTPGIVPALNMIVRAFTHPGDEIIVQTPVYYPFYKAIKNNGCNIVKNSLKYNKENKNYTMDLEDLKRKISSRTKMIIISNPHNPVGRVWTKEELISLGNICLDNNILVVSDEIHFDLIYKPYKHTVFASINESFKENCIICTAPSKTFNIAGLKTSNVIIPNDKLRKDFNTMVENTAISSLGVFGQEALIAAYKYGSQWLDELLEYLKGNLDYLIDFINKKIPKIKVIKPEGTYLVWLDCSELNMSAEEARNLFVKKVKLGLDDGIMFGEEGEQFQRINIACPRSILKEVLKNMEIQINNL